MLAVPPLSIDRHTLDSDPGAPTPGGRPLRVLVVDDDPSMRQMLVNYLEQHNMRVESASRHQDVARLLASGKPNVVILDLRLGGEEGLDLLREIRSRSDVPVIITAGHRCDEVDRVVGLELGADDYVTKPFGLRELLARISAVLRRQELGRSAFVRDTEQGRCGFAGWMLDRRTRRLTDPNGTPVSLTRSEYTLLTAFLDEPQRVLSREHLLQATRTQQDVFDRSIDVQILRLRRKLEPDSCAPQLIRTRRGVGYVFVPMVERL